MRIVCNVGNAVYKVRRKGQHSEFNKSKYMKATMEDKVIGIWATSLQ